VDVGDQVTVEITTFIGWGVDNGDRIRTRGSEISSIKRVGA